MEFLLKIQSLNLIIYINHLFYDYNNWIALYISLFYVRDHFWFFIQELHGNMKIYLCHCYVTFPLFSLP